MPQEGQRKGSDVRHAFAKGLLDAQARAVEDAGEKMLVNAPKRMRFVAKRIPGAPGLVYELAAFADADDKWRASAEILGGALGGAAGGGLGAAAGGVNAPIGAAVGAAAGADLATKLYDANSARIRPYTRAAEDFAEENWRRVKETARWIGRRNAEKVR